MVCPFHAITLGVVEMKLGRKVTHPKWILFLNVYQVEISGISFDKNEEDGNSPNR